MRILFLGSFEPDGQHAQCMLTSTLLSGLVGAFGSMNVVEPFGYKQWRGTADWAMGEWPVFLAATTYMGKPESSVARSLKYDAFVVNVRFLTDAVRSGLCTEASHKSYLRMIDPAKTILYDGSDSPYAWRDDDWKCEFHPALLCTRPSPKDLYITKWRSATVHISVPMQHIWRMMSNGDVYPCRTIRTYAAMNDNSEFRRQVVERLASSNLHDAVIRFGSGTGYTIDKTLQPIGPPYYYREIASAQMVCAARGGNRDTLRQSEVLALGRLLISDDPMWDPPLVDGTHYLKAETPDEFVQQCWWAIDNKNQAEQIARQGHEFFLSYHSCEQQAFRIIQQAGLVA